jgi:hypothetical protein
LTVISNILEVLASAHKQAVILDDIHADNFLIDENLDVHFIDLEFAHKIDEKIKITAKNPGYYLKCWDELDEFSKDLRKTGQLILYLMNQSNVHENQEMSVNETIVLIKNLFINFGYGLDLSPLLKYLLLDGNSAEKAQNILKKIVAAENNRASLVINEIFSLYLNELEKPGDIKKLIDSGQVENLGLNGLTGYLWKLSKYGGKDYKAYIEKQIEYLLLQQNKSYLHLRANNYSPYILNGSSGLGLFLISFDYEKYEEDILEIAEGLNVAIGKAMDFEKGLTGIAYFLLQVYHRTQEKKYLRWSDKILKTCQLYVKEKKLYNYYTKKYETDFLKGYEGLSFVEKERMNYEIIE